MSILRHDICTYNWDIDVDQAVSLYVFVSKYDTNMFRFIETGNKNEFIYSFPINIYLQLVTYEFVYIHISMHRHVLPTG